MFLQNAHRPFAVLGVPHLISSVFQDPTKPFANSRIIIGDQHGFGYRQTLIGSGEMAGECNGRLQIAATAIGAEFLVKQWR